MSENARYKFQDHDSDEVERLRHKVARLKDVTIEIQGEVTEQNRFLTDMHGNLDDLSLKLSRLVSSVKGLLVSGSNSKYFWYSIGLFVVILLIIIFFR
jgi:hypothetical protein